MAFTGRSVNALKPRQSCYEVWEGGGFGVRVGTSGRRSRIFLYHYGGRPRRMTLGEYPQMWLSKARIVVAMVRDTLESGEDPGSAKAAYKVAERSTETVAVLIGEYLERTRAKILKPLPPPRMSVCSNAKSSLYSGSERRRTSPSTK